MGNKYAKLNVFENIIDEAEDDFGAYVNSEKGKKQLRQAVSDKNIPYIFTSMVIFGIKMDSNYGEVNLSYEYLLKPNIDKFSKDDLEYIKTGGAHESQTTINNFYSKKFKTIAQNIYSDSRKNFSYFTETNDSGLTPLGSAIVNGDINTVKIMVKCFNNNISDYCQMNKTYTVGEMLSEHRDDKMWDIIYKFMEKNYDFTKLKKFMLETLEIKKELFEIYKLGSMCEFPQSIIHNIISAYHDCESVIIQTNTMANVETNINVLSKFNNMLSKCCDDEISMHKYIPDTRDKTVYLQSAMDSIQTIENLKVFWYWLKFNDDIITNSDIISFIFNVISWIDVRIHDSQIALLIIK